MKLTANSVTRGLTVVEVLIVLALLAILTALLLPSLAKPRAKQARTQCINNLRQIGLSFRQWAIDHDNHFPMSISATNGGSMEWVSLGGVYAHFVAISNDLNTPKILTCADDVGRPRAAMFETNFTEKNISYFVGLDATETHPSSFLAGDRNITNGILAPNKVLQVLSNSPTGWTEKVHDKKGNLALSDGSVQLVNTAQLPEFLARTGFETNRLAMPVE